jgi:hypothetical protein
VKSKNEETLARERDELCGFISKRAVRIILKYFRSSLRAAVASDDREHNAKSNLNKKAPLMTGGGFPNRPVQVV